MIVDMPRRSTGSPSCQFTRAHPVTGLEAVTGPRVVTESRVLDGHAVLVRDERVVGLVPRGTIPSDARIRELGPGILTPGLVDLHTHGAFDVTIGGAEANVAIGARRLGMNTTWVSCLPRNDLGRRIERYLLSHGVDVSGVIWADEGRVGLYFVEFGRPPRPTKVIYDRVGSSFAACDPECYQWSELLDNASIFHTTGVTAALGSQPARVVREAVDRASAMAVKVSFDLNYRAGLWSPEEADAFCGTILNKVDILFCSHEELSRLVGRRGDLLALTDEVRRQRGEVEVIVSEQGRASVRYSVAANGVLVQSRTYQPQAVDRIGSGDAAASAYLTSRARGYAVQDAVEFAAAAAAWQQTTPGDTPAFSAAEVDTGVRGDAPGIVR